MAASCKKISGANSCRYYQALSKEDYYSQEHGSQGKWLGSGAAELGLVGELKPNDERFKRLFLGLHPTDPEIVLRQGGNTERVRKDGTVLSPVSAYDLTFSAPKSVSVLRALSDEQTAGKVLELHRKAIDKTWQSIENDVCITRRGRGGWGHERLKPIGAAFEHFTSRENDPQLHTHVVLFNAGLRADGRGGTLDGRQFLGRGKDALVHKVGQIYRNELRQGLERELELQTHSVKLKRGESFELTCVPEHVRKAFSKRRAQIEEKLTPGDSSKAIQVKVLDTRKPKDRSTPEKDLFAAWQREANALGFDLNQAREASSQPQQPAQKPTRSESRNAKAREQQIERDSKLVVMELMYARHVERIIANRKRDVDRAFAKARAASQRRSERFKQSVTFHHVRGRINSKAYRRLLGPQPKSKLGIYAAHIAGRICKKRRDYLLKINGHRTRNDWLKSRPKTRLGINFAYATRRISDNERLALLSARGHLSREVEAERLPLLFPSVAYRSREKLPPRDERPPDFQLFEPKKKVVVEVRQKQEPEQKIEPLPEQQHTRSLEIERER